MVWLVKITTFLKRLPLLAKIFSLLSRILSLVTPNGLHLIYKRLVSGKCDVVVDKVNITDDDESGFTANITIKVKSKNKEALTLIKTEIENKPLNKIT